MELDMKMDSIMLRTPGTLTIHKRTAIMKDIFLPAFDKGK